MPSRATLAPYSQPPSATLPALSAKDQATTHSARRPARRRTPVLSPFAKLVIGYLLLQAATVLGYLATGETPPLGEAFRDQPVLFGVYVATIVVASIFGRRAHKRIAGIGRYGLSDTPGGDRLAVFFPAVRVLSDPIRYINRHPHYLNRLGWLLMVGSAMALTRVLVFPESIPPGGGRALEITGLLVFPLCCLTVLFHEYYRGYLFQVRHLRRLHDRQKLAAQAIHDADILRVKNKEQEEIMALVAHKFRGSLDRMVFNIEHGNSPWVYRESVSTMRGLLDIFGLISADTALLRRKLREDRNGTGTLEESAARSLGLALSQLLSPRGSERIQQHLLAFARRRELVEASATLRAWHERHCALAEQLRGEWQVSLMETLPRADWAVLREWIAERFFVLETTGLAGNPIRFTPYGTTDSLLTILLTEGLTNLFKYYASAEHAPAQIACALDGDTLALELRNPTTPSAAAMVKGSGRGRDFIALLVEKLDGSVVLESDGKGFRLALKLPAGLFAENGQ